ncbi:MAG: hypothetical protein IH851_13935, partial [Armatimonadetes bacterium]|nr:hypothetical protein [Armatimonadota bacterium]
MFWEILGLLGILTLWGAFGLVPWCAALVVGRGRGALVALPLAFAAGVAGGALVPAVCGSGGLAFGISLLTATAAGGAVSMFAMRRSMQA